jgi:RsiW-degrading membrane proteinase PrsW (M82 family)|tara:strand:+ start:3580 stop:3771 length:192 start_codon:yes stop_codon:yes gene_type:complete
MRMSQDISDSQIAKNITIFFVVIMILTVVLAVLGYFIQGSDYRAQIEQETRDSLVSEPLIKEE